MAVSDRELEFSPLGGLVTRAGATVEVKIYRFAVTGDEWALEIVDTEGRRTVFNETFSDDVEAYDAFEAAITEYGIRSFSDSDEANH